VSDKTALIQLDVEGHELQALKGAEATISRSRPIIAIEDNNKNCSAFLSEMGYAHNLDIPGLGVWIATESEADKKIINEFRSKMSA
jgi:hypothetical protein